jgi:flavin reductase (DIM6/NTAB) family NADH-FMN oxidoreductase RutF
MGFPSPLLVLRPDFGERDVSDCSGEQAMPRVDLDPDYWLGHPALARETYERMTQEGILIASLDARGNLNPMTIGWGLFGLIWGRPMFQVLVRPSRYTYGCLEHTGDYTVNVLPEGLSDVAAVCGIESGRDLDKMAQCELTPLPSKRIASPGITQATIVFECMVVHYNDVQQSTFPEEIITDYYPEGDFHRVYFGQIMAVSVARGFFERHGAES